MFEDLNWKWAARRAVVVIAIYLGLFYLLSVALPESGFSLQRPGALSALLFNAAAFFIIFTFIYAFVERSRRRRLAGMQNKDKQARPAGEGSEGEPGALKGRPNPNTSRKKARRRR
jgi:hypothetical protein